MNGAIPDNRLMKRTSSDPLLELIEACTTAAVR
jgi:hypothetical protein